MNGPTLRALPRLPASSKLPSGVRAVLQLVGGALVLAVVAWRVGTGPFLDGVRTLTPLAVVTAVVVGVPVTVGCAWRWRAVAEGLGVRLRLGPAVAAYYRSQFLNSTLPWGILGDVHRAVRHGRDTGAAGPAARAVVWERLSGQVVQLAVAVPVLALTALLRPAALLAVAAFGAALTVLLLLARPGLRAWPVVAGSSVLATTGHALVFVVAARTTGTAAPLSVLLPIALVVLLAMSVPLNVAGWGPREGAAAWAFGFAGLGAAHGVATATAYGVLALAASLPGAGVLLAGWLRRAHASRTQRSRPVARPAASHG